MQRKLDTVRAQKVDHTPSPKPYITRKIDLKTLKTHTTSTVSQKPKTMAKVLEKMLSETERHNISMPVSTCIIKHEIDGGFEFALETPDSIKHYIFEDM